MLSKEILTRLRSLGTAQNRKVLAKHGAPTGYLGVSFANLEKIKKEIIRAHKKDLTARHTLAIELWKSGVCDAQILAAMVAVPKQLNKKTAKGWIKSVDFYLVSNYLGGLFSRTDFAVSLMEEQMRSKKEYIRHNGYDMLTTILKNATPALSKEKCQTYLKQIEQHIHSSPNRARNAMTWALIGLGVYRSDLYKPVMASAKRIGQVVVDHGETSCKTPDAVAYIEKARSHYAKKAKAPIV